MTCFCGHPKADHADCGVGPCRANVKLALYHDSNDTVDRPCPCRSYLEPGAYESVKVDPVTGEVDPNG